MEAGGPGPAQATTGGGQTEKQLRAKAGFATDGGANYRPPQTRAAAKKGLIFSWFDPPLLSASTLDGEP